MSKPVIDIADDEFMCSSLSKNVGEFEQEPSFFDWKKSDPRSARFVTDRNIKDAAGRNQIAWLIEPFFLHPENYFEAIKKNFNHVLSHNRFFVENNNNWLWYPFGGTLIPPHERKIYRKTKSISVVVSPKNTMPGHRLRHEIARKYRDEMEVFGLDGYVKKIDAVSGHRYSIVVENEKSASFFSEKIIDCFLTGTIPVYWGCPDIGNYFNERGILDFKDLDELEEIIRIAKGEKWYHSRQREVFENMELAKKYIVSEDWIFENYNFLFKKEAR